METIDSISGNAEGFYENVDGIYQDIPDADYHGNTEASMRCSQTILSELWGKSPAHAKTEMEGKYEPKPAQIFGQAFHSAVLRPDVFDTHYSQKGRCEGITGGGGRCTYDGKHPVLEDGEIHWFCGTHRPDEAEQADVEILSESKMEQITRMKEALQHHPASKRLLYEVETEEVASELTVLWTYDPLGIKCKSRIDRLAFTEALGPVIVDLKTTRSAKPGTTPQTIGYFAAKYGYHRQAAFYMRAIASHGIPAEHYFLCAIEKKRPHDVVAMEVTDQALTQGDHEIVKSLRQFSECKEEGAWPGYQETIEPLELPVWAYEE